MESEIERYVVDDDFVSIARCLFKNQITDSGSPFYKCALSKLRCWREGLKDGDMIDIQHGSDWFTAKILTRDKETPFAQIHYCGWHARHDAIIDLSNKTVYPEGTVSKRSIYNKDKVSLILFNTSLPN